MESNFNLRLRLLLYSGMPFAHFVANAFIGTIKEDAVLSENVICS
jgi:hypothetical protein